MSFSVLIVDDHQLIRQAWNVFITANGGFSVIAECSNGKEAVDYAVCRRPDVILMDINLPDINGVEATRKICQQVPGVSVIGVSSHADPSYARKMIQSGASGYLTKNSSSHELILAMTAVLDGKKYICEYIKNVIAEDAFADHRDKGGLPSLSKREKEIIDLVKKGLSSKEMASLLALSVKTIEVHRSNILRKLKLKNSAALVNHTFTM
jgi:DNA-binding NarL/FixJ family response regulator